MELYEVWGQLFFAIKTADELGPYGRPFLPPERWCREA
jgi:hypothetical protein